VCQNSELAARLEAHYAAKAVDSENVEHTTEQAVSTTNVLESSKDNDGRVSAEYKVGGTEHSQHRHSRKSEVDAVVSTPPAELTDNFESAPTKNQLETEAFSADEVSKSEQPSLATPSNMRMYPSVAECTPSRITAASFTHSHSRRSKIHRAWSPAP
jgi:hypothetical protein